MKQRLTPKLLCGSIWEPLYRHTYATIWQAGALFTAISAALVAFAGQGGGSAQALTTLQLAPLPFLFWWIGIFSPMDTYGDLRRRWLERLENQLSEGTPGVDMCHFRLFNRGHVPPQHEWLKVKKKLKVWPLRVNHVVHAMGIVVLAIWLNLTLGWADRIQSWIGPRGGAQSAHVSAERPDHTARLTGGAVSLPRPSMHVVETNR